MDNEPSTSSVVKRSLPKDLQNDVDAIATKLPRVIVEPADLDDNQKRWLFVGICLHSVISPALRKYIVPILTKLCYQLSIQHRIDTQTYPGHLQIYPPTNAFLNYGAVNNNKCTFGNQLSKYDYTIKNVVDLSKLFLQTHMAHYTGFNETCDSSALLGLIINIDQFPSVVKSDAGKVRNNVRNPWAHCDFTEWDAIKYATSFQLMEKLVMDLNLSSNDENQIVEEINKWKENGQRYLSGMTFGLQLVKEIRQQTQTLAKYSKLVVTETDNSFLKIKKELDNCKKNSERKYCELKEKMKAKYEDLKSQETQIGVKPTSTRDDLIETPVVDNQNVPLLAMFDMTKVNKRIKEYISDAFENMKGNLTVNIKEEIKDYFNDMKQNSTDAISEARRTVEESIKKEIKDYFDDMKQNSTDATFEALTPRDCSDLDRKKTKSGVYKVFSEGRAGFNVYCDMETDGGGWTGFQRRQDGKVDFFRGWKEYVKGFGDVRKEFWLGNDKLHDLTSQGSYELRVDLEDFKGDKAYAKYSTFNIGDQSTNFKLTVNGYIGTAGDALAYHNNQAFTTKDKDNDHNNSNCAEKYKGGWWYKSCHHSNLNGLYLGNQQNNKGIRWWQWKGDQTMKTASMMIRRT